jgi:hypothetical protein
MVKALRMLRRGNESSASWAINFLVDSGKPPVGCGVLPELIGNDPSRIGNPVLVIDFLGNGAKRLAFVTKSEHGGSYVLG